MICIKDNPRIAIKFLAHRQPVNYALDYAKGSEMTYNIDKDI